MVSLIYAESNPKLIELYRVGAVFTINLKNKTLAITSSTTYWNYTIIYVWLNGILNSKRLCLQQIYGEGKYKDCNDLPIGESAIAFSSALNKPDANMYFIFCIGSMQDKIKIQYAMRYALVWNVRIRIYDFNDGTWSNWH